MDFFFLVLHQLEISTTIVWRGIFKRTQAPEEHPEVLRATALLGMVEEMESGQGTTAEGRRELLRLHWQESLYETIANRWDLFMRKKKETHTFLTEEHLAQMEFF